MSQEYEKATTDFTHAMRSEQVMVCSETGRVIAVFYNDYDLDDVLSKLNNRSDRAPSLIDKG